MRIEDVQITADKKQTPELNEDGTLIEAEVDPTLQEDHIDGEVEDLDDEEHIEDEGEDDKEFNEDGTPKEKVEVAPVVIEPVVPTVDYKKKFSDSTRRNQIVESQFRELQKVLGDITKQEIPTDAEMTDIDPDWEYRSDFEKNLSMKILIQERRQNHILSTIGNITKESEVSEKVVTFIESTPELKGKEEKFYDFATYPKNHGASPEVLLKAFLYEAGINPTDPILPVETLPEKKAPSLNRSAPRVGLEPKSEKTGAYSDEELTHLRTKDPKKYFQLIRQKKI